MVTIKDIAKAAASTYVTVSRALNDKPAVSEQTRQAIMAIAEQMDTCRAWQRRSWLQPNTMI